MRTKAILFLCFFAWIIPFSGHARFIASREELKKYSDKPTVFMITSTGRSGSTMLTDQIKKHDRSHRILKSHLLPPEANFKGKIIFIFSNPDKAAESALYMTLHNPNFGGKHFNHLETADHQWLEKIGGCLHQTEQDNLLAYDALGINEQLKNWLYEKVKPSDDVHSQILAIKYENLWEDKTIKAIRLFLDIPAFKLPPKKTRGYSEKQLYGSEKAFRKIYNLGTDRDPRYAAYHESRILWDQAPPFQFLELAN